VVPFHHVDEKTFPGESPQSMVRRLSFQKAHSVSQRFKGSFILGADTTVVLKGKVLGKPRNRSEAVEMIRELSGRTHLVYTGLAFLRPGGKGLGIHVEKSSVIFQGISGNRIREYTSTREPYDKAGGYDIQGVAGRWVSCLEGDYFNVMGLPLHWLMPLLTRNRLIQSGSF
jgi:septum formation protein